MVLHLFQHINVEFEYGNDKNSIIFPILQLGYITCI